MTELLFILLFGLCMGSFITCASYRMPLEIDVVKKPSYCPKCNTRLGFKDLWPVLSWLLAGGKCRHCAAKIPLRYPAIELLTAAVFLLIHAAHGFTLPALLLMLMASCLLILIVADLEHYIIPDEIHLALLPLGLGYHAMIGTEAAQVAGGFVLGLGLALLLHHGYRWLRGREGLGYGDVKFFAVAGLWLTPLPMVPFLLFSGLFGIAFGILWRLAGKGAIFPFGPSLAAALFVLVCWPQVASQFWALGTSLYLP
jgi:leader peptidase (prepilin peptidase)/N-methyltransferase